MTEMDKQENGTNGFTELSVFDDMEFNTPMEPYRIHSVIPIKGTTILDRQHVLEQAGNNMHLIPAEKIIVDLLTDSGTGAMSNEQWACMHRGDESYANATSWYHFLDAVQELFPFKHVLPTHQGRAAERILTSVLCSPGKIVPNNSHFSTTCANIHAAGSEALDLPSPDGLDPENGSPFKGNMDLEALERLLATRDSDVAFVYVTVTNNSLGGQPVSIANMEGIRSLCDRYNKLVFLDACRFAENAYFIKERELGQSNRSIPDIVRSMAALVDGMTMSAKKDGLCNIGGWLAMNDDILAKKCRTILLYTEGYFTYGGLAGRDLEAIAQGLKEVVDIAYLTHRIKSIQCFGEELQRAGVPVVKPIGGTAVYINARALLPHVPALQYPAQSLAIAIYLAGGIRPCEIGTVMFGAKPDGTEQAAALDLVRLTIPRRTYTKSHLDYVVEVCSKVAANASKLGGYRIVDPFEAQRHFTAVFVPLKGKTTLHVDK